MKTKTLYVLILSAFIGITFLLNVQCTTKKTDSEDNHNSSQQFQYKNHAPEAKYVGIKTCTQCHQNIHDHFKNTGMGKSFGDATKQKSSAKFGKNAAVYDKQLDFYYHPLWENEQMFIMEYRLKGKDTVHKRIEKVDYIIGSGQHTNSHLMNVNGYVYQLPMTYYTQKGTWDLPPGFEKGANSRFSRIIGLECMTCHNGMPKFEYQSENKFISIKKGIDCERCHGPGSIHVKEKKAGIVVDTSKSIDYSIVNPKDLSRDLQMDLCQRCHLQGIAVLEPGKNFDDFKPGMKLSDFWNVYMPKYSGAQTQFIMASHVERLKMSKCYLNTNQLSCVSCHNPHYSVKETPIKKFNTVCENCHSDKKKMCTEKEVVRMKKDNDCSSCHMQKSGSIDIPHVAVTDHYIRKPLSEDKKSNLEKYVGLTCINNPKPPKLSVAKAYLAYYEKFSGGKEALDSVSNYLFKVKNHPKIDQAFGTAVHLYFIQQDFSRITTLLDKYGEKYIHNAWTFYRIGEAFYSLGFVEKAINYYQKAVDLEKYNLDFHVKLGNAYTRVKNFEAAKNEFEFVTKQNPKNATAWSNLGFIYLKSGKIETANIYYDKALALNPDYEQALLNKAGWLIYKKKYPQAKEFVEKVLKKNPKNEKAKEVLKQIKNLM